MVSVSDTERCTSEDVGSQVSGLRDPTSTPHRREEYRSSRSFPIAYDSKWEKKIIIRRRLSISFTCWASLIKGTWGLNSCKTKLKQSEGSPHWAKSVELSLKIEQQQLHCHAQRGAALQLICSLNPLSPLLASHYTHFP